MKYLTSLAVLLCSAVALAAPAKIEIEHRKPANLFQLGQPVTFNATVKGLPKASGEATAVIEICDDGPGIPLADQPHIFERFYRGATTHARRRPGSGLGLAIAKALVELHDGHISVTSSPGAGATFSITVPCVTNPSTTKDETA